VSVSDGGGRGNSGNPGSGSMSEVAAAPPRCYRHPDRETYLACVRCDRPICPDCMVQASVGFQCRDCVRSSNQGQRAVRTAFGGRLRPNQSVVTYTLIGINVIMFLVEQSSARFQLKYSLLGATPLPSPYAGIAHGEYYRLVTSMFLHNGITHILFNMWALFVVGPPLEAMLGRVRFAVLYFLCGLTGSTLAYALSSPVAQTVGASGAIFGLFGALFVVSRRMRFDIRPIGITIVANLIITFAIPNISWQGHLGGLGAGLFLMAAWVYVPRNLRTVSQFASSALVGAIIAVGVILRTHELLRR
jgi:membrane associated rhomboid family serine protease